MLYAIVAIVLLIFDQALKLWVTNNIVLNVGTVELIPGVLHLTKLHNYGAAFSFMQNYRWFFVVLCVLFCAVIIYLMAKNIINGRVARWTAIFVMAGALGNCIDRIINGYVVDMLEFDIINFPAVFNLADVFITVGGVIFCICILIEKPPKDGEKAKNPGRGDGKKLTAAAEGPVVHETTVTVDPSNPFADWDSPKSAPAEKMEDPVPPKKRSAPPNPQEENERPQQKAAPRQSPAARRESPPVLERKRPEPKKQEPDPRKQTPQNPAPGDDFDLESILDEFKD